MLNRCRALRLRNAGRSIAFDTRALQILCLLALDLIGVGGAAKEELWHARDKREDGNPMIHRVHAPRDQKPTADVVPDDRSGLVVPKAGNSRRGAVHQAG